MVETPIKLSNWDHLVAVTNLVNKHDRDWAFSKSDHEAAYKQLPVDPPRGKLAVISLRSPNGQRWYGFVARTLVSELYQMFLIITSPQG